MNKKPKTSHASTTSAITPPLHSTPSSVNVEHTSCSERGAKKSKLKLTARIGQLFKGRKDKEKKKKESRESRQKSGGLPRKTASKSNLHVVQPAFAEVSEKTCKSYRKTKEPKKPAPRASTKPKICSPTSPHNHPVQKELPEKPYEYRPPPISVEKVEKSLQNLLEQIQPKCVQKLEEQWDYIDEDVEFKDEEIAAFLDHGEEYNQAEEVECPEVNRVKLEKNETRTDDYIHASYVEIKEIPRKFVLAQLPTTNSKRLEDFWAMVYQEKLHNIYMICSPEESSKPNDKFSEYFPINNGHHEHYEQIWVHNRKVEMGTDSNDANDSYIIEVLPNGCAESILVTLQMLNYWPMSNIGSKTKKILASASNVFGVADAYEGDPVGIISKQGAGRTGTYLAIVCAIQLMKNGQNFDMKGLCKSIRRQRPGGIDQYCQFVFIYSMVFQFASQHVTNKELKANLEKASQNLQIILSKRNNEEEKTAKTMD